MHQANSCGIKAQPQHQQAPGGPEESPAMVIARGAGSDAMRPHDAAPSNSLTWLAGRLIENYELPDNLAQLSNNEQRQAVISWLKEKGCKPAKPKLHTDEGTGATVTVHRFHVHGQAVASPSASALAALLGLQRVCKVMPGR
eukprot:CAMPEP_0202857026 /NCGR_PEP_ID=MMETSP1391-20130828/118_1 /ASSEMBLY_ACC=CAM_ASM_000867 /TAXON_ID=1034604 /ORGANISM="Chlamydomonas leiostraca, Strain SAG 11-49" /LENGTH=141 /DNA_ID=CAMNT_0049535771 /DNA_START=79 /DNA_END=505 /DNA_ORIENTATION=+